MGTFLLVVVGVGWFPALGLLNVWLENRARRKAGEPPMHSDPHKFDEGSWGP